MERLTFDGNFCDISKCGYRVCPHDGNCSQKQVWQRLKQFEDAFGTPEKAERVKLAFMGKAVYEIKEFNGVPIKRLIELAEAEKDGRVLILPPEDYAWKIRGDIMLGIITANCRRAEAEKALQEMKGETEK